MSAVAHAGRRRRVGLFGAVLVLALAAALPVFAAKGASPTTAYVVQLASPPVASYQGGTRGIPATSPRRTGRKLLSNSTSARAYRAYLDGRQRVALARLGSDQPAITYSYRTAFAGFAARLTKAQVTKLRKAPEVARVNKDEVWKTTDAASDNLALDNATFPDGAAYLDLPEGLWDRLGGSQGAGEGVIVGDIDTGIQPNHPSFAGTAAGNYTGPDFSAVPDTWGGACQTGPGWTLADCNNKLIGARFFVAGYSAANLAPGSFLSPRDDDGHGSHTASTAAGNFGVDPAIDGNALGVNQISGIAPRARVAAYKVCWVGGVTRPTGCVNSDSVAAIDAAVEDGVDVINYSIGSPTSTVFGSVPFAFLGASDAGVFVSTSAGNDGPGAGTVGSPTSVPWVTSVAASTLARTFQSTASITAAGAIPDFSVDGASVTGELDPAAPLADAALSGAGAASDPNAELCLPGTLAAAKVTGRIVLCKRGDNSRIDKSKNVQLAGGVGMILFNASDAQELVTDTHWVPSVHVSNSDGLAVRAAIADPGTAQASLTAGTAVPAVGAVLAAFSSRGPQSAVPDIARPDVTAPGVNILAAAADQPAPNSELKPGNTFQSISGTSMSSPHVAGAAALLTQLHPTFSSSALKSSLMTSADPGVLREDGSTPADPFDAGSGEIDPNAAADPGLVLDVSTGDYISYLAEVAPEVVVGDGPKIKPFDLNLPSLANSQLPGAASTSRTFTSVDSVAQRWTVAVEALVGVTVTPSVSEFTIKPGQSQAVGLAFRFTTARLDEYVFGALVLTNGSRTVRLPISVKPIRLKSPATIEVQTDKPSGTQPIPVQTGYTGQLRGLGWGLAAPTVKAGETIPTTTSPDGSPILDGTDPGTKVYPLDVAAGSQLFATNLSNVDGGNDDTDLDLFVFFDSDTDGDIDDDDTLVGVSASGGSEEHVEFVEPDAGHYGVAVVGFDVQEPQSVFDLNTWVVTDASPDDPGTGPGIKVSGDPFDVAPGDEPPLALDWSNVKSKGTYMGVVTYHDSPTPTFANRIGLSLVELEQTAEPATTTPPATTPTPTPPVTTPARLRLRLRSARLSGRTLTLRLTSSRRARIQIRVRRSGRSVARASSRTVTTQTRVLRVRLDRRVRRGRTYTVRIAAFSGRAVAASSNVRMRVR